MKLSNTVELAKELIARRSLTPDDAGCQQIIAKRLLGCGFHIEHLPFNDTQNLWARHGTQSPLLLYLGHTDVVPPGPENEWICPPFEPTIKDGLLYGRGAADMKSSIAAMITAVERFTQTHPNHPGSIGFLITSDEEGKGTNGTVKAIEHLHNKGLNIEWCIVGEPSSSSTVGDTIKNGRRGSLLAVLTIYGVQGHVAYPDKAINPIHAAVSAISELSQHSWEKVNKYFPPTNLQFTNIQSGAGAENVIPGALETSLSIRFSTTFSPEQLQNQVEAILKKHKLNYKIEWRLSGMPFLTLPGKLIDAVSSSIREILSIDTSLSTAGGTSDGRFVAPLGAQIVELGVVNDTIHKINEHVKVADIDALSAIYERALEKLFA